MALPVSLGTMLRPHPSTVSSRQGPGPPEQRAGDLELSGTLPGPPEASKLILTLGR